MFNYIKKLFEPKLDAVLGQFSKVTAKLEKVEAIQRARVEAANAMIAMAERDKADATSQATRAATVKTNINNLLGG